MALAKDYASVMGRNNEIMKEAMGLDYDQFESGKMRFDYEGLMASTGYTLEEIERVQSLSYADVDRYIVVTYGGGKTLVFNMPTASATEATAKKMGYKGVMAATSGNYGAAVASQAAMQGLKCIIVQECFDSHGVGQPEIIEKARKCEAYGAEVVQLTVGPELFYTFLSILEDTGYFNASLYSPYGIAGVETLGYEIAMQCREKYGKDPAMVVCTSAGGGMMTGTARGLMKAGATNTKCVAASIDLTGLHMASDTAFNKKSCTTGHTGFGVPYAVDPDHSDVPRSAARPLRYMERYVTVKQFDVMYITEALANLEGIERGPAGNTALAAAFSLAQELPADEYIIISETEYTGAGKHVQPQLAFARENGIEIRFGDPNKEDKPGVNIILPKDPSYIKTIDMDLVHMRKSFIKKACKKYGSFDIDEDDIAFLAEETNSTPEFVKKVLEELK